MEGQGPGREGENPSFRARGIEFLSELAILTALRIGAGSLSGRGMQRLAGADNASAGTMSDHTVIAGYGVAGRYLARVLNAAGIPCIAVEQDANLVRRARVDGVPAAFGDGSQPAVLVGDRESLDGPLICSRNSLRPHP